VPVLFARNEEIKMPHFAPKSHNSSLIMYEQTTLLILNAFTNLNHPSDSTLAFRTQEIKKPHA
jgi:hypothetical protein